MKQKYSYLFLLFLLSFFVKAQTATLPYNDDFYTSSYPSVTLNNFSTCQVGASITASSQGWNGGSSWSDKSFSISVNGSNIGTYTGNQTIDITSYLPITSVQMNGNHSTWSWVDLTVNITSTTASMPATGPTVANVTYVQGDTASPLTATLNSSGATLKWYTDQFGDNYSTTAPTPSTGTVGTTSYFVAQANASGCESERSEIIVTIIPNTPATHLNFDGANDYVDLGNTLTSTLIGANFVTVEAWVFTPSVTGTKTIVGNHISNGAQFNLRVINDRLNGFLGFGAYDLNSPAGSIVANTWQHVAMVYNDTTLKLYIDGVEVATMAIPAFYSLQNSVQPYRIGASGYGAEFMNGNVDDVRIWNVAKTPNQLAASKNCELQGTESGLIAYYKFNQGIAQANNSAITTLNATTGPNGTLTNFNLNDGSASNWLAGSQVTSGSIIPSGATVTTPVIYTQGATATALTATAGTNGTGLMWYTVATGGAGSVTAPIPSTATSGSTSYWVSSTNANGCESDRVEIVVTVNNNGDDCVNAIALTVGSSSFNDFPVDVNLTGATNSSVTAPACGNYQGGDRWYTVTVPASGNVAIETNGSGTYDTGLALYTGSCGALTYVNCDDNNGNNNYSKFILTGQTPGAIYYVRVWENFWGNSNAQFQISAYDYINPATHLNLDGVNDYVEIPKPFSSDFTMEYWVKTTATGASGTQWYQGNSIVNNEMGGVTTDFGTSLLGDKLAFGIGAPDVTILSTSSINDGSWKHIAVSWEQATGEMKLYVNGVLESSGTGSTSARTASNSIKIGTSNTFFNYFNGDIDELRIWNKVLNATDITNTMNCELQSGETGIVAYYKFNQGFDSIDNSSVTMLTDAVGTNHGTLTNFALTGAASNWKSGSTITTGTTCTTLSASGFESISNLEVYPNPSTGSFNISAQENLSIEVYDLVGKIIVKKSIAAGSNSFDISGYAPGVYLLKAINAAGAVNTYKIVKQ